MSLNNPWVSYLNRSYKSIKASILNRMKTTVPEITDHSESNIFVIIISIFAGLIEQLNYYIDNIARELYLTTARRYSSIIKLTRLIDYRVRAKVGATVDVRITAVDGDDNSFNVTSNITINSGAIIKTDANIEFITQQNKTIFTGTSSVLIPAKQRKIVTNSNIGTTTSATNQVFEIDSVNKQYQHNTLQITIDSITWELRQTFAFSGPQDKHFIVEMNESKEAWVKFGDNINGAIPPNGQIVYATYYRCLGLEGNVEVDTIVNWVSGKPSGGGADDFEVTNSLASAGGINEEDLERIRIHAPLSLRTLDRAVTLQDHKDIAMLVPGVGKVSADVDLNLKTVILYIAPDEGGTASSQLQIDVKDAFDDKKLITTLISAAPAGETELLIKVTVTAKFRRDAVETKVDIEAALLKEFGFNNSDVDKKIIKSDIIALIDNLDKVDYLKLDYLTCIPYPRPYNTVNELSPNWLAEVQSTSFTIKEWRIRITDPANGGNGTANLYYMNGEQEIYDGEIIVHTSVQGSTDYTSQDGTLKLAIWGTDFSDNNEWRFKTYPYNEDHEFEDFSVPVALPANLDITVNEQLIL